MDDQSHAVVRRVLHDAGEHERFFDYSDAERLVWMIDRAFQIGKEQSHVASNHSCGGEGVFLGELKQKGSKPRRKPPYGRSATRRRAP